MVPCPEGTYRPYLLGESVNDCIICDPGKYCSGTNNTAVTGNCAPGYYCNNGSHIPNPVRWRDWKHLSRELPLPQWVICPTGMPDRANGQRYWESGMRALSGGIPVLSQDGSADLSTREVLPSQHRADPNYSRN
ncbi:hypothetical protein DPMN_185109 [Dreissena polymorpha]|uniref:Uncharacterized protein n=1 Tax=Dreissena polymorpha TaxID=45954 RepID=A0A9D4I8G0_DREPO|nr:hypothetical protein DPMN_185109 [Dreissena polymorpha]